MKARLLPLWLLLCLALPSAAGAHPMPSSEVFLDLDADQVRVEIRLPVVELEPAFKHPLPPDQMEQNRLALMLYTGEHIRACAPDGRPWTLQVEDCKLSGGSSRGEAPAPLSTNGWEGEVVEHILLKPPAHAPANHFSLFYDVITHEVVTHSSIVSIRSDFGQGLLRDHQPQPLGIIRWSRKTIEIDRTHGSWWRGFALLVKMGMQHIAEGTDHILFVLTLLLPAPLIVFAGRWAGPRPSREALGSVAKIVTAFTLGHSLTLALGTLGAPLPPSKAVEVFIALSIVTSAFHALRPLFPNREAWIAGAFGLIHGMAFSDVLRDLGLQGNQLASSLLGFNLGIEIMQLAIVIAALPILLALSRTRGYTWQRPLGAGLSLCLAIFWVIQRLFES